MFGNKEKEPQQVPAASNKSVNSKDIKTLIGEGCKIEGNFFIPTATRIDGTIKGDLTGDSGIVIGLQGTVEGNICASEVVVYGTVNGNIETMKLELKKGSYLNGNMAVTELITEAGCSFNGKCSMNDNLKQLNVTELAESNG